MLLLVGLGNPSPNNTNNRHNVGFLVIDAINQKFKLSKQKPKFKGLLTTGKIDEQKVFAIKPLTFMNNSGVCIKELIDYFNTVGDDVHVTWSTSPKLSISGEKTDDALIPDCLLSMNKVINSFLYTKFVVRNELCFEEVDMFVDSYKESGVKLDSIFCMPEGATLEQQTLTEKNVADTCMETGYKFSPRLHITLFGNAWGT